MDSNQLIAQGTAYREATEPEQALACYGQAFIVDPDSAAAFNNYGNTLRELGRPDRAIPFLQHATLLDPSMVTARFNLAVCHLLLGNLPDGFQYYENRWDFEHLAGTLPNYTQPRWSGQDLKDKTILVLGEQGHGDIIQFVRFVPDLIARGAKVHIKVTLGLIPLLAQCTVLQGSAVSSYEDPNFEFDYWTPMMSLPLVLGTTLETLERPVSYLNAPEDKTRAWQQLLGPKYKLRIGFCWSGRKDSWINRHKSVPFDNILNMVQSNPDYEWVNLQTDASAEEEAALVAVGVKTYPSSIQSWADTAALISNMDVVVGMDTAVSHLSAALGRPTWIMLSHYAVDWRWLLNRDDSPWYITAKLFRQPQRGDWASVIQQISQYLTWFKA
jgi:hypothetical protein